MALSRADGSFLILSRRSTRSHLEHRSERCRPAGRTLPPMTPVLRDVRRDRGQLGDLMPARIAGAVPRVQPARAAATALRDEVDDRIHTLGGHHFSPGP